MHSSLLFFHYQHFPPPETWALGLYSIFAVAVHNTHCTNTWSCILPNLTCHIHPRVRWLLLQQSFWSYSSADHSHSAPELPFQNSKPSSRTKIIYSQHHNTSHTNIIPLPQPFLNSNTSLMFHEDFGFLFSSPPAFSAQSRSMHFSYLRAFATSILARPPEASCLHNSILSIRNHHDSY